MTGSKGSRARAEVDAARTAGGTQRPDARRGVYGISVAAELSGMGVQTLRLYEARGLLAPHRTEGGTRRYSADDLELLGRIGELLAAGLNLAGIYLVLELEAENGRLRRELDDVTRSKSAASAG